MTTQNHDLNSISDACLRLREITERKGQKITNRDVATAHLARSVIEHLKYEMDRNMRSYSEALSTSVDRGIQLDALRAVLSEINQIAEIGQIRP